VENTYTFVFFVILAKKNNMTFGAKLIKLRKNKNLSLEQLALELDLSKSAVAKWESDESKPNLDNLMRICDYYQMDIYTLLKDVSNVDFSHATFEGNNYVVNPTNTLITYHSTPENIIETVLENQKKITELVQNQNELIQKILKNDENVN